MEKEHEWVQTLPETVRDWDEITNATDPEHFWKQIGETRSYVGDSLRVPGDDADQAAKEAFYTKLQTKVPGLLRVPGEGEDSEGFYTSLGRPENVGGYKLPEVDSKGVTLDSGPADAFKELAFKYGLSQAQFEGIVGDMTNENVTKIVEAEADKQKQQTQLRNEWGLAYADNMKKLSNLAANTGAPQQLLDSINNGLVDINSAKWLLGVANSFKGESQNLTNDNTQTQLFSPQEAKMKISEIRNNKKHPYWNTGDPGHKSAKEYMRELYKMAVPNTNTQQTSVGVGGQVVFK